MDAVCEGLSTLSQDDAGEATAGPAPRAVRD
jgi:hypothetical protein